MHLYYLKSCSFFLIIFSAQRREKAKADDTPGIYFISEKSLCTSTKIWSSLSSSAH